MFRLFLILLRFAWEIPSFILIGKKNVWCDQMAWINYGFRMIMIVDMGLGKHILNKRKHDVRIIMTMTTSKQRGSLMNEMIFFFFWKINSFFFIFVYWFLSIIIIISDICCEIYRQTVDSSGKLVRFVLLSEK
jgi:hypothetical protein